MRETASEDETEPFVVLPHQADQTVDALGRRASSHINTP